MQGLIDVLHDPVKQMGVDVFGQGISGINRLAVGHVFHISFRSGHQFPTAQPVLHLLLLNPQQPTEMMQMSVVPLHMQKDIA